MHNDNEEDEEEKPEYLYDFEEILLEAIDCAQEAGQKQWANFILTVLTAVQEGLEEEFAVACESFLKKTAEIQKENEEDVLSFHFTINRTGNS